jgi:hypothetical protein
MQPQAQFRIADSKRGTDDILRAVTSVILAVKNSRKRNFTESNSEQLTNWENQACGSACNIGSYLAMFSSDIKRSMI